MPVLQADGLHPALQQSPADARHSMTQAVTALRETTTQQRPLRLEHAGLLVRSVLTRPGLPHQLHQAARRLQHHRPNLMSYKAADRLAAGA